MGKITIVRDTAEKVGHGWKFPSNDWCSGTVSESLYTGDYAIKGYENDFVIERKGSPGEFAGNIFEKRFFDELKRLKEFKYPYIFLEFNMADISQFPIGSGIPPKIWNKLKVTPKIFLSKIWEIELEYNVPIKFVGKFGQEVATSLFRKMQKELKIK